MNVSSGTDFTKMNDILKGAALCLRRIFDSNGKVEELNQEY